ncbi:glycosyltransferase family 4 protein [Mobiluncus curtisii]|uniref:glycosyltransferase family 4 protein n=1 Tax=Mobiluncus curtisii TaxID=2051 RepID=UPI001470508E|nr:glycosyltransferase family 4 protein [Mobiluncus curtisii]MCV0020891.1 glycosyltransferase family 4 protein [Mobiluncus curtisii]NMW48192.1 glycosyltransferase family 4 protein [Mobiluncus curtisii]
MKITMVMGEAAHSMGTFVASLSSVLVAKGHDVQIIAEPTSAKRYRLKNVLPLWLVTPRRLFLIGTNLRRLRRAQDVLKNSDVIHVHGLKAALYALVLTTFMPNTPPLLVSLYELNDERRDTVWRRLLFRWMDSRASLISGSSLRLTAKIDRKSSADTDSAVSFLVSPRVEKLLQIGMLNRKERVSNWTKLAAAERLRNRGQLVLGIGPIEQEKHFDRFVRAMQRVTYPATGVVIGDGDPQLLAGLRSYGTDAQVSFLGWRKSLDAWLQAASVLVITSEWESRGFIAQEAMSLGLPIVAAPVGKLRDILLPAGVAVESPPGESLTRGEHLAGTSREAELGIGSLVVDTDDADATAQAITKLLANPSIWYEKQESARHRAATWPTTDQVASEWLGFYRRFQSGQSQPENQSTPEPQTGDHND